MSIPTRTMRGLAAVALAAGIAPQLANAQETNPLTLVVGFSPGGGVDTAARLVAQELTPLLGRTIIVENRPGAASMIAADAVARAAPDGNTLLFAGTAMLTAPVVAGKTSYDPIKSFAPVAMLARSGLAIAVPNDSSLHTVEDLIRAAKAEPGAIDYASSGIGSLHHLAMERLSQQAGLDMVHVPYKGGSQAAADLASGQVDMAVTSLSAVMPHVAANRARLVAMLSAERDPAAPDLPTVAETIPGVDITSAMFIMAPAGTPQDKIDQIAEALKTVVTKPLIQQGFENQDAWPSYQGPAELAQWLQEENALWLDVIEQAGLAANR